MDETVDDALKLSAEGWGALGHGYCWVHIPGPGVSSVAHCKLLPAVIFLRCLKGSGPCWVCVSKTGREPRVGSYGKDGLDLATEVDAGANGTGI